MPPKYKTEAYLLKAKRRMEKFIKRSEDHDCWLWTGKTNHYKKDSPYGMFSFGMKWRLAHRVSYALAFDNLKLLESPEILCLHRCDTPLCVNPKHITLGTHADNMRDMEQKGRRHRPFIHICPHCGKEP